MVPARGQRRYEFDRRRLLGLLAGAGAAGMLANCAGAGTPTDAPAREAPGKVDPKTIVIPDSGAKLPTGKSTVQWTDSSQFSTSFVPSFVEAYQKKHSNITLQYENLPDPEMIQVLQLAFQNNTVPDVFRIVSDLIPSGQAVDQGLVQPLDELVPNFDEWKNAFPDGSFTEGINVFNGKTYSFPMLGNFTWTLQYNREYMERADLDPLSEPFTFEGFRAAAKKLTKQGAGQYYGVVCGGAQVDRWSGWVGILGNLGGAVGGEFDYSRGTYNYTSDAFREILELIIAMKDDKSIDPGSASLDSQQARATLPTGQNAMILNETGVIPFWLVESPDFDFEIAELPVPDGRDPIPISVGPPAGFWWVGADSKNGAIIGDIFSYLGSLEGQKKWQQVGGGGIPVHYPEANLVEAIDERLQRSNQYFLDILRTRPDPAARAADVSIAIQQLRAVTPDFGTVVQGIYTGQVEDVGKAMQDLQDRSESELDRAIEAARKKGADVSRDDWVFPNWDPTQNYTQADYDALG